MEFQLTHHAECRLAERDIRLSDVEQALTEPLISYPSRNRLGPVTVYIGQATKVVVADDVVVTVIRIGGAR